MSAITDNTTTPAAVTRRPAAVTIPKAAFNAMTKLLEEFMAVDYPERMKYLEAEVEEAETKEDKRVALAQLKAFVRYGKIFNSWLAQDDQQSLTPRLNGDTEGMTVFLRTFYLYPQLVWEIDPGIDLFYFYVN